MRNLFFLVLGVIICSEVAISFNSALLPNLEQSFAITHELAQMTVAFGLLALGIAGFLYGGISDCIGRRPVYLFSLALFTTMSLICALSTSFEQFIFGRFFQGFGSGAGWIIGNACLSDVFKGKAYENIMNKIHAAAGVIFAAAPIIGSYLANTYSWQLCFWALFGFSGTLLIIIYFKQPETLLQKKPATLSYFKTTYTSLFKNKNYRVYLFLKVAAVSMLFCELSHLPIVLVDFMKIPPQNYGWVILPCIISYILTSSFASIIRIDLDKKILAGYILLAVSNFLLYFIHNDSLQVQLLSCFTFAGWGLIFGNATAKIIESSKNKAGAASAVMITTEMMISALAIFTLSYFFNGTLKTVAVYILLISIISINKIKNLQLKKKHIILI